jgi:hypothetical protein
MSSAEDSSEEVRQEMIEAIDRRKWEFTKRAIREGLDAFRTQTENPSDEAIIDYILNLLQAGYPWTPVERPAIRNGIRVEELTLPPRRARIVHQAEI